jgi:hypothetical protein
MQVYPELQAHFDEEKMSAVVAVLRSPPNLVGIGQAVCFDDTPLHGVRIIGSSVDPSLFSTVTEGSCFQVVELGISGEVVRGVRRRLLVAYGRELFDCRAQKS